MSGLNAAQLEQLETFINVCRDNPAILHIPELKFFKNYLVSLGSRIPPPTFKAPADDEEPPKYEPRAAEPKMEQDEPNIEEIDSSEESEIELDDTGVIEEDETEPLPFGDDSIEVTEEMMEESCNKRAQGQEALSEGKLDEALQLFTEAIQKNPQSAPLYAKRAGVLIKQQKPVAAIRDCDKALTLNPDSALAYKFRGRANQLLGYWEEAALDLANSLKIDYSDDANDWLKEVHPNAKKIQEHRRKYERKREQKELKEREERLRKAKEAREKAAKEAQSNPGFQMPPGGMPFMNMPGMPGATPGGFQMPAGFGPENREEIKAQFDQFLKSPQVIEAASKDPEVAAALDDLRENPANLMKYVNNPKIMNLMESMEF